MIRAAAASIVAGALASGCAFDAGRGFATMKEGELRMALEPGRARDLGDGAFLTDRGYRVHVRELTVGVHRVAALELSGGGSGGSVRFDPASPPPGYTLCHGDHCHAEDGRLVSYEDVQAMLAGGEARFEPLVTAPVDRELDLLEGERAELSRFEPSAELPQGSLDRLEVDLTRLRLAARLEGGALAEPVELEADLPLVRPIARPLSLTIDRDGPEEISLAVSVRLDATAFDGVDLAEVAAEAEDGALVVEAGSAAAEALVTWLARAEIEVAL